MLYNCITVINFFLLLLIIFKLKTVMTNQEQMQAALDEIAQATTDIGNRIQSYIDAQAAGNVTQDQLTQLQADADALKLLGNPPVTSG